MEWTEEGIVLTARRHGESSAIVSLLTREQGRHAGLVRGGFGRAQRGLLEPGNRVRAHWRARLAEHLGTLTCEAVDSTAAALLDDPLRLAALAAATAVAEAALPEREPHARVHDGLQALLDLLLGPATIAVWGQAQAGWERDLLADLGFGLDLTRCAVSGTTEDLAFVSPKTGRAVSRAAAQGWRDRLLPLPVFLARPASGASLPDIVAGLVLTGFFLERHGFAAGRDGAVAAARAARQRLIERLDRAAAQAVMAAAQPQG